MRAAYNAAAAVATAAKASAPASVVVRRVLFVGLGNMGFPPHMHSVGHLVLDGLARRFGLSWRASVQSKGLLAAMPPLPYREPPLPKPQKKSKPPRLSDSKQVDAVEQDCAAAEASAGTASPEDSVRNLREIAVDKTDENGDGCGPTPAVSHVEILLYKPSSMMNVLGPHVRSALQALKIPVEDFVAVHDELEKAFGKISLKHGGSAGGHNGVRSITSALRTDQYRRLRVGIGRPEDRRDVRSFVLAPIADEDMEFLEQNVITPAGDAILRIAGVDSDNVAGMGS